MRSTTTNQRGTRSNLVHTDFTTGTHRCRKTDPEPVIVAKVPHYREADVEVGLLSWPGYSRNGQFHTGEGFFDSSPNPSSWPCLTRPWRFGTRLWEPAWRLWGVCSRRIL